MANEITVRTSLQIRKGPTFYQSQPTGFTTNWNGSVGPTPGTVTVANTGTDINLSQLKSLGGLCRIACIDQNPAVYFEYGLWDPDTSEFYPLGECLSGESYVLRLSRYLGSEFGVGPGTGTSGHGVTLRCKAVGASTVLALVEAFDA